MKIGVLHYTSNHNIGGMEKGVGRISFIGTNMKRRSNDKVSEAGGGD